jgi:hypothetical protein
MSNVQSRLTMLRRRLGVDDNPLRRRSDRVQTWLRLGVCALFVGGLVVAGIVGHSSYRHGLAAEQRAEQSHQVTAHVVSVVSWASDQAGGYVPASTRVVWHDAAGRRHTEDIVAQAYAGESVRVWVDPDGRASLTRHTHARTLAGAVVSGLSVATIAAAGLFSAYFAAVLLIDRRREATWDREWLVVEPGWRRQEL